MPEDRRPSKERIYLKELAWYLHHSLTTIRAFAKRHGWLRTTLSMTHGRVAYVSPYAAQRIIAYIRAVQGDEYLQGRQFHEVRAREAELLCQRRRAKKALAISRAGAEDRASEAPANIGIAETAVVCMNVAAGATGLSGR